MSAPGEAADRARPGRWKRRLVLAFLGVAVLIGAAPFFAGPLLAGLIVRELEARLALDASLQTASFRWPARLCLRELELTDAAGARVAALDELVADVRLGALLAGGFEAEVRLAYPELHVARTAQGEWNWERILADAPARPASERRADGDEDLPDVRLHLAVSDGHVVVHGPRGDTTLADIALDLAVEGLATPAPFHLSLGLRGPAGPAGGLDLAGSFTAAQDGRMEPAGFAGEARVTLERLELAALAPALSLVAPIEGLAGVLEGTTELALAPGLALTGSSTLTLDGLTVAGPRSAGSATRLARVELSGRASQDGSGSGTQVLEVRAESFLTLTYSGHSELGASGSGTLAGELRVSAELGRLAEVARGWVPLQAGVTLGGRAEARAGVSARLVEGEPAELELDLTSGIEGLSARAQDGRPLELGELREVTLALEATADRLRDTLSLPQLSLRAGPVTCSATLEAEGLRASGFPAAVRTGSFLLRADLDRLRGALASLIELGDHPLAGQLTAEGRVTGQDETLGLDLGLEGSGLAFGGATLADVRGEVKASREPGGALVGQGELTLGALTLPLEGLAPLVLPALRVDVRAREDAAGAGEHALVLATADGDLRLALEARTSRQGVRLEGDVECDLASTVAALGRLAEPFTPLRPGLDGRLSARGTFQARASGREPESLAGRFDLRLVDLTTSDAAGGPRRLAALAETTLAVEGRFDARAERAVLETLRLGAGGLTLSGHAELAGLRAGGRPTLEEGRFTLECDPDRIGRELAAVLDLGGWSLAGSPLTAEVRCRAPAGRIEAEGRAESASLRLTPSAGRTIELAELALDFGLGYDLALASLHVRSAELRTRAGRLALAGTLNELANPARARGVMRLEGNGAIGTLRADLGLDGGDALERVDGSWKGAFSVEGDQGAFRVTGQAEIERFQLALRPAEPGGPALVVEEPKVALSLEALASLGALDVDLQRLTLDSGLARGGAQGRIENLRGFAGEGARLRGLTGHLAYVPDRLGVVLAPWLPGKLSGSAEERVTFTLDGPLRSLDLLELLASSEGRIDLGLGRFERPELVVGGQLALEARSGELALRGDLAANEGTLQLDGVLALTQVEPARSRLSVTTRGLRANAGLAPLLALVHPVFASLDGAQGSLQGLIDLSLDLTYDAPLSMEALGGGWEALPKPPINGTGRLALSGAALRASPLLTLLGDFGVDVGRTLDVRPIEFSIEKGRVRYAKPWTWTFADTETTFTGSVGLDQSLDLSWNVPITEALSRRWSFLESMRGESLALPLRGTVRAPRLEAEALLADLAGKVAKKELEGRLGLGDRGEDPAGILARADELWSRGEKAAAAALYSRLREDFKLSLTYALNKDRIKERSRFKETPK